MSNRTNTNPLYIDTWSSDVNIFGKGIPVKIRKVRLYSAAAGDLLYLENAMGDQIALIVQTTNGRVTELDFGDEGFSSSGLTLDVSDCTGLGSGDVVWIYID